MKAIEHLAQVLESLELEIPCDYLTDLDDVCCKTCSSYTGGKKECWLRYAEAMEKQEQDRWTPVTERLPEVHESGNSFSGIFMQSDPVLVYGVAGYEEETQFHVVTYCDDLDGHTYWSTELDALTVKGVKAWRPLPEPYTEEEA